MEQQQFSPELLGFTMVKPAGASKVEGTFISVGKRSKGRNYCNLVLDEETTSRCREMFGDRVDVAISPAAEILIMEGNLRKLANYSRSTSRVAISLDGDAETFINVLGSPAKVEYKPTFMNDGSKLLLQPVL